MLTIEEIKSIIPQRYPFLLIDRVLEYQEGISVVGIKNVTINEPFFEGHFPDEPIMPGFLILESMAQLSGCFLMGRGESLKGYVASVYNAMFFRPVVPGDQMILKVELTQQVRNLIKVKGHALVEEKRVAKAQLGFIVFTSDNKPIPELSGYRRD